MNIGKSQWLSLSLVIIFFFSGIAKAEIYSWKDENGKTHFGDQKTNHLNQKTVDLKKHHSQWKKFDIEINDADGVLSPKEIRRYQNSVGMPSRGRTSSSSSMELIANLDGGAGSFNAARE